MATTKKYVVLADIESIRVPFATFNAALEELATFGEVAVCKFYGYSAKRTKDYGEFIQENSYDALSTLPKKRKGKLDLRQVIDAARLAQYPNVDGFFLIYGKGDITPLISYLKGYGKDVIAGVIEPDKNSALCNKVITLDLNATIQTVLPAGYKKVVPGEVVEKPKRVAQPKPAAPVAPAAAPAAAAPAQPAASAQSAEDAQFAMLMEQFNKIIAGSEE